MSLPEWEEIRLWGRSVFVAFDSDVMVKASVQAAFERLVGVLKSRGAHVRIVTFPTLRAARSRAWTITWLLVRARSEISKGWPKIGFGSVLAR